MKSLILLLALATQGYCIDIDRPNNAANLLGTVGVSNGGTGATSFTQGRILYGGGTSAIQESTGLQASANGAMTVNGSSLTVLGNIGVGDAANMGRTTSDGSDSGYWTLSGGGSGDANRGSYILLTGNEQGNAGLLQLTPGITGVLRLHGTDGTAVITISTGMAAVTGTIKQDGAKNCSTGVVSTSTGALSGCLASDQALKKNIRLLTYNENLLDQLKPSYYEWKDAGRGKGLKAGFIAQEVERVFPSAVVPAGANLKGIDPNAMIAALVSEVQALRKRVAALEKK